jgi:uncharacterized membrane protein YqaE (UPF0057 family)
MRYLLALVLPPAAVLLSGKPRSLLASVPLTVCFWVPGVLHAILVIHRAGLEERAERLASVVLAREERRRQLRRHQLAVMQPRFVSPAPQR